jgi:hypothetical protein
MYKEAAPHPTTQKACHLQAAVPKPLAPLSKLVTKSIELKRASEHERATRCRLNPEARALGYDKMAHAKQVDAHIDNMPNAAQVAQIARRADTSGVEPRRSYWEALAGSVLVGTPPSHPDMLELQVGRATEQKTFRALNGRFQLILWTSAIFPD